jgi:hypothetical protein
MTSNIDAHELVGTTVHFSRSGLTYTEDPAIPMSGRISARGHSLVITPGLIEGTTDKSGRSWLELLDDPDGQVARWGHQFFARGEAPEAMALHPWERGSAAEANERSRRVEEAHKLPTQSMREEALRQINAEFPKVSTHTSSLKYRYYEQGVA